MPDLFRSRLPRFLPVLFTACMLIASAQAAEEKGKFYGARKTEYPAWFKQSFLDFNEDIADATAAGKRLMVLFTQDGCPYCNALVERNLAQKKIEQQVRKNFDVVAINMWGDKEVVSVGGKQYTEKSFAEALKVQFTPTILFFNAKGKVVLRLNGYLPPERFRIALDYVAGKKETTISYRDFVAANLPKTKSAASLNREEFFQPAPYDLTRNKSSNKPVAVFFEQRDCPDCDLLHKRVLIDKQTREVIKQFDVIQLDMWSDTAVKTPTGHKTTARKWAKALDVKYAPTIVLFDAAAKEVIRSEAFFKVFHTQGIFHYVLSGSYRTQASFQRYLANRAKDFQKAGQSVDIWRMGDESTGEK